MKFLSPLPAPFALTTFTTFTVVAILTAFFLAPFYADAAAPRGPETRPEAKKRGVPENLDLTLGLAAGAIPEYSGANSSRVIGFPLVLATWHFDRHHAASFTPYDGLSYIYTHDRRLKLGLNVDFRQGRDSSDATILSGMPDIDATAEAGPWIRYRVENLTLKAAVRADIAGEYDGYITELGADYKVPLSPRWAFGFGGGMLYGNEDFMETYYGVSSTQATATRPRYTPSGGFAEARGRAHLAHFFNTHWFTRADIQYARLMDEAKDSSVVLDEDQWRGFLSVGYKF